MTAALSHTPTNKLFSDVENPTLYRQILDVPIFTTFKAKRKDPQTGNVEEVDIDEDKIREVVATQNAFEKSQKGLPRITPGHTLKDPATPEGRQPPPWGWSKGWRFGRFDGKPAIFGTLCLSLKPTPDDSTGTRKFVVPAEEAGSYPYRSPEYYDGRREITGVALLRRDPQLDLGVLTLNRPIGDGVLRQWRDAVDDSELTLFAAGEVMPDPSSPSPSMPSSPSPSAAATDASSPSIAPAASPTNPPEASAPAPEASEQFMACMRHHFPHLASMHDHMAKGGHPKDFAMAPSMTPASPNTLPEPAAAAQSPSPSPSSTHMTRADVDAAIRMAREQDSIRFARVEQELTAAKAEVAEERAKRLAAEKISLRNECERRVIQWEAEGIQCQRGEEVEQLVSLADEAARTAYETRVRSNYRIDLTRMPTIPVAATKPNGQPGAKDRAETDAELAEVEKRRETMQRDLGRGVSFAEAETAYFAVAK